MIELSVPEFKGREVEYLSECIKTGWVSTRGPMVERFEKEFSSYLGVPHAVATCSGTAALHAALLALEIGPGDEVVVPALTFIASANPVLYTGAVPVFADLDRSTWGLDVDSLKSVLTRRTRAVIIVHLYGFFTPMDDILQLAEERGFAVIEDATEALGTTFRDRPAGTFGTVGCFSFNGNKIITTGSGGMVVTGDSDLSETVFHLTTQARSDPVRYEHDAVGYNYRLPNIGAALGLAQLEQLPAFLKRKRLIAGLYDQHLNGLVNLELPPVIEGSNPNYWLYSVLLREETASLARDELVNSLRLAGVQSRAFFSPIPHQKPYCEARSAPIPASEYLARCGICLPSAVKLTDDQVKAVCWALVSDLR